MSASATTNSPRKFTLASRTSELAQIQTNSVRDALRAAHPDMTFETAFMTTGGDKNQSQALYLLGGKALWTKELEVALLEGEVDMLVHSLKDVPTELPQGCEIAGVLERENPVDCLIVKKGKDWTRLEDLPDGSVVGTSSVRRVAQLKRLFPGLAFKDVVSINASLLWYPPDIKHANSAATCGYFPFAHTMEVYPLQQHPHSKARRPKLSFRCDHPRARRNGPPRLGPAHHARPWAPDDSVCRLAGCARDRDPRRRRRCACTLRVDCALADGVVMLCGTRVPPPPRGRV